MSLDHHEQMLRDWFTFMVPFYIEDFRKTGLSFQEEAQRLNADPDFMERILMCEPMLFGLPDTRRSKDAYAHLIAVLSFAPGGIKTWGLHFEAARGSWYCARVQEPEASGRPDLGALIGGGL